MYTWGDWDFDWQKGNVKAMYKQCIHGMIGITDWPYVASRLPGDTCGNVWA
jgi:hypothetical protein